MVANAYMANSFRFDGILCENIHTVGILLGGHQLPRALARG